jgi:hypothetical protein
MMFQKNDPVIPAPAGYSYPAAFTRICAKRPGRAALLHHFFSLHDFGAAAAPRFTCLSGRALIVPLAHRRGQLKMASFPIESHLNCGIIETPEHGLGKVANESLVGNFMEYDWDCGRGH